VFRIFFDHFLFGWHIGCTFAASIRKKTPGNDLRHRSQLPAGRFFLHVFEKLKLKE
jgi:hypothetical protein